MKLEELLERFPEGTVSATSLSDPECLVHSVSFLTSSDSRDLRGDVLYFGDSELLPSSIPENQQFSCIIVDNAPIPCTILSHPNVNLIWLGNSSDLFACYNAIQTAFLEDQALYAIIHRMLAAHFSNQGLQFLVEETANALKNPIVVVDPLYRYIAYHLGDLFEDNTKAAQVMVTEMATEQILEEAIAYIRDTRLDSEIARSKGPYEQFNSILQCNTMTLAVMVRGVCVAHVMMLERSHPFRDIDREAFIRLAGFIGQELQKSEVWEPTSGELGSYFLENLLNDRSPSVAITRRRLKSLNFHPKPILYAVCLHAPGEGLSQTQAEHIAAQLRPILHHSLYTRHHQQLVIVLSRDEDEGFSEQTERKLRDIAILNGLTVGVSNAYVTLTETRTAYEQARAAIRYGNNFALGINDDGFYRYCDYAYVQALDLASRRMNLMMACHPALQQLISYDERHGCELMETLFCYLQVAGSTARAAKLLNLHKNTMLYRLGRIKEVLGMKLESGEELFMLQISFRALMNLGIFSPRLNLSREELSGA